MKRPLLTLIVARARNGAIGIDGGLPWRLPEDLAFFRRTTMGHPILMGRRTYESIGRPLPGRRNLVLSRSAGYAAPGCEIVASLDEALRRCGNDDEIFVIGGAQPYRDAMPRADRLVVTEIDADFDADVHLPPIDAEQWAETSRIHHPPTESRAFGFDHVTYTRRQRTAAAGSMS
ncbi:MAG TPA: dihydrofolate reductase [Burkholderiaceae bacterium]|nr:dihydrofolate reductase [Burkholderiaceae bacterium]